jgi:hypothetical protein
MSYIDEVSQCIQKRYLYIPINQLHRGSKILYTEEVPIYTNHSITQEVRQCIQKRYLYIPINQLHRGGKTMYLCVFESLVYIGTSSVYIVLPPLCN